MSTTEPKKSRSKKVRDGDIPWPEAYSSGTGGGFDFNRTVNSPDLDTAFEYGSREGQRNR